MDITPIRQPWKGNISGRDRFLNQMNFRSFDRSFNMEFGYWEENYHEWDLFAKNGIRTEEQANTFFQL